jgi:hypothetical protein
MTLEKSILIRLQNYQFWSPPHCIGNFGRRFGGCFLNYEVLQSISVESGVLGAAGLF